MLSAMRSRQSDWPGIALTLLVLIVGCTSADSSARFSASSTLAVRFYVSGTDSPMLKGVKVYLITKSGESLVGTTDALGSVSISRQLLQEEGALAVLFCHSHFFCGAYRITAPGFHEYDEHYIGLAPFAVR